MPIYAVTDKSTGAVVMVEASRSETAISALVAARFETTVALTAGDALRLAGKGVKYLLAEEGEAQAEAQADPDADIPGEGTRVPVAMFSGPTATSEPDPIAEVEAGVVTTEDEIEEDTAPAPTSSDWGAVPFGDDDAVAADEEGGE